MLSGVKSAAMLGEKSGSSAADPGSPLSAWMGGSGAAVLALCVFVAALCACAAFLLYRAVRGRSEGDTGNTAGEQRDRAAQSTGVSDEGGSEKRETNSSEAVILSSTRISAELPEESLRESIQDLPAGLIPDMRETSGTQRSERYEGHDRRKAGDAESVKVEADLFDYQYEGSKQVEDPLKESICDVEELETELHGDVDEPSETESAQETLEAKNVPVHKCQSVEDLLDNTLLAQDVVSRPSRIEPAVESVLDVPFGTTEADDHATKMDDEEAAKKGLENGIDRRFQQVNEFDCCCYDEQTDLLSCSLAADKAKVTGDRIKGQQDFGSSNGLGIAVENSGFGQCNRRYDPVLDHPQQNYLGFITPSLQGDSAGQVPLPDVSREKSVGSSGSAQVEASHDKNEINIMEAIMDSNEWLSTGPPDTRELPWLTQSNTGSVIKTNTSVVTPAISNTTDQLKQAPANTSYGPFAEESRSQQEKTEGLVVAPEDTVIGVADDEEDFLNKKVAAVSPMPQMVRVSFKVHYITHSPSQLLAVTGNQQELGAWESFVPLQRVEDWFWANTITLPAENQVEWKFVLVEDGKIRRWEECGNRHLLVTGQEEEIRLDKSWGYM